MLFLITNISMNPNAANTAANNVKRERLPNIKSMYLDKASRQDIFNNKDYYFI